MHEGVSKILQSGGLKSVIAMMDSQKASDLWMNSVSPLEEAYRHGDVGLVTYLLQNGADANQQLHKHDCPILHMAVYTSQVPMVRALLKYGANINARSGVKKYTTLMYACFSTSMEMVALVTDAGANINEVDDDNCSSLWYSIQHKTDPLQIKLLLDRGADPNVGQTMLFETISAKRPDLAQMIVDAGANTQVKNAWGKTLYEEAQRQGVESMFAIFEKI